MYKSHAKKIQASATTRDGFRQIIRFVHLTIQEPLHRMPAFMAALARGDRSALWGWKDAADQWHTENASEVFDACHRFAAAGDEIGLVAYLSQTPGLGVAKGGFVAQLAFGVSGCIDSHNASRFGIPAVVIAPKKFKRFDSARKHAERYCAAVAQLGGSETLWDSWCEYVGNRDGYGRALGAEGVSALHCTSLGIAA